MKGKLAVLGTAAALVTGVTGMASTAQAHNPWPSQYCEPGALCVWWDGDYNGGRYPFFYDNRRWLSTANAAIHDDDSSSANNGTSGLRARIYRDVDWGGTRVVCLPRGYADGHHSPNDEGSSNIWTSGC